MAVSTWEKGKLVDDAQASYFASCYDMENYIPIDYHVVTTPQEIAAAAGGRVNVFTGGTVQDLYDYMQGAGKFQEVHVLGKPSLLVPEQPAETPAQRRPNLGNLAIDQEQENLFRYGFELSGLEPGDEIFLMDGPRSIASGSPPARPSRRNTPGLMSKYACLSCMSFATARRSSGVARVAALRTAVQPMRRPAEHDPLQLPAGRPGELARLRHPHRLQVQVLEPQHVGLCNGQEPADRRHRCRDRARSNRVAGSRRHAGIRSSSREGHACLASQQTHRLSCPGVIIVDELTDRVYPDRGRHLGDCHPPKTDRAAGALPSRTSAVTASMAWWGS